MYGNNNLISQTPHCGNRVIQSSSCYDTSMFPDCSWQQSNNQNSGQYLFHVLHQRKLDINFLNKFIDESSESSSKHKEKKEQIKGLGISETKTLFLKIKNLNLKLREAIQNLEKNKTITFEEWQKDVKKCHDFKNNIKDLLRKLLENEKICSLNKLLKIRKNKRLREKKMREKIKRKKFFINEKTCRINEKVDIWIREKQEEINREKQNENLKKDADIVLSDIRGKRSDARKYISLLHELKNLRKVMVSNARARGENLSAAADKTFENIIEQLSSHWNQLDQVYSIEEQGLKLMLQTDNENSMAKQKKNSFDEWEIAIFGRRLPVLGNIKNLNHLIMTRFAWDKFININNDSSRIPLSWIMPDPPTSLCWQKCLKKH